MPPVRHVIVALVLIGCKKEAVPPAKGSASPPPVVAPVKLPDGYTLETIDDTKSGHEAALAAAIAAAASKLPPPATPTALVATIKKLEPTAAGLNCELTMSVNETRFVHSSAKVGAPTVQLGSADEESISACFAVVSEQLFRMLTRP
jgi:hypothetical protein